MFFEWKCQCGKTRVNVVWLLHLWGASAWVSCLEHGAGQRNVPPNHHSCSDFIASGNGKPAGKTSGVEDRQRGGLCPAYCSPAPASCAQGVQTGTRQLMEQLMWKRQWRWWWAPEITTLCHWSDQLARLARAPAGGQGCGERLLMEDAGKAEVLPVCFVSVFSGAVCSLAVPRGSRGIEFFNPSSKKHFLVGNAFSSTSLIIAWMQCQSNILCAVYKCII